MFNIKKILLIDEEYMFVDRVNKIDYVDTTILTSQQINLSRKCITVDFEASQNEVDIRTRFLSKPDLVIIVLDNKCWTGVFVDETGNYTFKVDEDYNYSIRSEKENNKYNFNESTLARLNGEYKLLNIYSMLKRNEFLDNVCFIARGSNYAFGYIKQQYDIEIKYDKIFNSGNHYGANGMRIMSNFDIESKEFDTSLYKLLMDLINGHEDI